MARYPHQIATGMRHLLLCTYPYPEVAVTKLLSNGRLPNKVKSIFQPLLLSTMLIMVKLIEEARVRHRAHRGPVTQSG